MKSLLKKSVFALSLSLSAMTAMAIPAEAAQAAVPTDASLLKLVEVTKVVETMNDMSNNSEMIEQAMLASIPNELNASQRQRFDEIIRKYSREMADKNEAEKINKEVIDAYIQSAKQHFNQQEVDAQIAFYSSQAGQSIIDKQPAMMKDYMAKIMPIVMESTMKKMQEVMPKMAADIKALKLEE